MDHRHHDQNRNHIQSSIHPGNAGSGDNGSLYFRTENMLPGGVGVHLSSNWNSTIRSNEYIPSTINTDLTHHHPPLPIPVPSYHHPLRHPPADRTFLPINQSYTDRPSSSHYIPSSSNPYGHVLHGYEDGNTSSSHRGPSKRKRTNGYHTSGSVPTLEKQNSGSQRWPWEVVSVTPSNRGTSLSISGESSQRNVRSRSTQDLDVNQGRAQVLGNPAHYSRPGSGHGMVEVANLSGSANTRDWNRLPVPSDDHGRTITGQSASTHDMNHFHFGSSSTTGSSLEIDTYHHQTLIPTRNPNVPPQNIHYSNTTIPTRTARSTYTQRVSPAPRSTRSYHHRSSDRVLQSVPENYSSNYMRPSYMIGWRNNERSSRLRLPYQRPTPFSTAPDVHDRLGLMMVEHSSYYESRSILDQHRDMRLDVDNMSYEELLALGERIGEVSTGLSEDMMSKCLKERIHYSSFDKTEEEGNCVICLEEYKSKEIIATLVNCGHDYHTNCIKKWLSMKKVCPICKANVVGDS